MEMTANTYKEREWSNRHEWITANLYSLTSVQKTQILYASDLVLTAEAATEKQRGDTEEQESRERQS